MTSWTISAGSSFRPMTFDMPPPCFATPSVRNRFGDWPMPMHQNLIWSPQRRPTSAMISASLPMNPSVSIMTMRTRSGSSGSSRTILMPLSISVPPPPRRPLVKPRALAMFSGVQGTACGKSFCDWLANVTTWTVSVGLVRFSISRIVWMTLAVGAPDMEPETSMRNEISRGGDCLRRSSSPGWTMSMKYPWPAVSV